jgi:hypothetical protein
MSRPLLRIHNPTKMLLTHSIVFLLLCLVLIFPIVVDALFVCENTTKDPTGNTLPVDDKTAFPTCK